jgi:hypothetical protein
VKNVDLGEGLAVLALLVAIPTDRLAASALAELLSAGGDHASESPRLLCAGRWRRRGPAGGNELPLKRVGGAGLATLSLPVAKTS